MDYSLRRIWCWVQDYEEELKYLFGEAGYSFVARWNIRIYHHHCLRQELISLLVFYRAITLTKSYNR